MTPLLDMQRQYRELGRLRTGVKTSTSSGKERPTKLDTWRVTSPSERLLDEIAVLYGGEVVPWTDAPNEGDNFEVITESDSLNVLIPPGSRVFSQYWELWKGGGCAKRCDGVNQLLVLRKCSCPSIEDGARADAAKEGQACSPHTRLQVMLAGVSDLGIFRLETHSYNAASEMMTVFEARDAEGVDSKLIPARLRLEQRSAKRDGKTSRFAVPVIELSGKLADAVRSLSELDAGETRPLDQLAPTTEGRSLVGPEPSLSSDRKDEESTEGSWGTPGGASPPDVPPLPSWLLELPSWASDETIIEAAEVVARKRGKEVKISSLEHLGRLPISEESQQEIKALLETDHIAQGSLA